LKALQYNFIKIIRIRVNTRIPYTRNIFIYIQRYLYRSYTLYIRSYTLARFLQKEIESSEILKQY